ncbi:MULTISPECIES: 6-phospho-beta-glucosidase [unclassified Pseudoclavibacter]|uniref:6-phospho-beta-glucosidase n=1 Tax=unclassified Pseudoclavibacter TaxID=2615177 RepID=UPI000CE82529|nr:MULTISPECIES: 6-phospho-beta-glucosidase [unclassified Pseudoclavibacter]PPF77215.1 6-phospho-beta-glucosidase [Pseudoclavibacter sp. Z016]PPG04508.1 6-phospho-beta-glucosidase [Pseudoclavibacter sp. RFBI5]
MKLTIIGGGGFRVPQVFEAVASDEAPVRIDELSLYDVSPERLAIIRVIVERIASEKRFAPRISVTTDLEEALRGTDFVFSAVRVGGTAGRVADERIALELGVLGQETVGPGGLAYALRTIPIMVSLAETIKRVAPDAWVINFTNPAGIVTEAMRGVLGDRVVGICDTPIGLMRRAAAVAGARVSAGPEGRGEPSVVAFDYVGLNHLGWLRSLRVDGVERLPELLASDTSLQRIEEARLLGFDWVRALGALPNEYLYYYSFTREANASIRAADATRGEYLDAQQGEFFANPGADPFESWMRTRHEREASYMAESREEGEEREVEDVAGGGYESVALDLMAALSSGRPATMILNVRNGSLVPALPDDAVVEVGCVVDADGVHPWPVAPVEGEMLGLMVQVKSAERLVIEAATRGSRELAWRGFAAHPLVDSVGVARKLVDRYSQHFAGIGALLR